MPSLRALPWRLTPFPLYRREADVEASDLDAIIHDLLTGEYNNPVEAVGFNTAEGCSRDVSEHVPTRSGGAAIYSEIVRANLQDIVEGRADRAAARLV